MAILVFVSTTLKLFIIHYELPQTFLQYVQITIVVSVRELIHECFCSKTSVRLYPSRTSQNSLRIVPNNSLARADLKSRICFKLVDENFCSKTQISSFINLSISNSLRIVTNVSLECADA